MSTEIKYRTGTYRSASPESTRDRIRPMLDRFSITRVADITDLDEIGLPTMVCYRPDSKTFAVSIGSGIDAAQAYVSAAMESIEAWHMEYVELPVVARGSALEVGLDYDVRSLNLTRHSLVTERTPLDWVAGRGLLTGAPTLVPAGLLRIDSTVPQSWRDLFFVPSTNGSATGNTFDEAVLHAMFEVIERGCTAENAAAGPGGGVRHVNPESATNPATVRVVEAVATAGCSFQTVRVDNSYGLAYYEAEVWSEAVPFRCGGYGCHIDPEIAFGRALSEAAQSRLAMVSGARDDIDGDFYRPVRDFDVDSRSAAEAITDGISAPRFDEIEELIAFCARRIREVTGFEPFTVDLTQPDIGIPMSKVIAPGVGVPLYEWFRD